MLGRKKQADAYLCTLSSHYAQRTPSSTSSSSLLDSALITPLENLQTNISGRVCIAATNAQICIANVSTRHGSRATFGPQGERLTQLLVARRGFFSLSTVAIPIIDRRWPLFFVSPCYGRIYKRPSRRLSHRAASAAAATARFKIQRVDPIDSNGQQAMQILP